ncbi:MAG TPA: NlpC/P60 family protein [Candidatus Saccharimonas sp.]|nr:NlpC/P60 family protein [Candidatus Saccharimonas sp.]
MANPDDRIGDKFEQGKGAYSTAGDLKDAENANSAYQDGEGSTEQPGDAVRDAESSSSGSWSTNLDSFRNSKAIDRSSQLLKIAKKSGPGVGVVGFLITLALGFSTGTMALLPVHIKQMFMNDMSDMTRGSQMRLNKLLAYKMSAGLKGIGVCGNTITIRCKFATVSDKYTESLKRAGFIVNGDKKSFGRTSIKSIELPKGITSSALKDGKTISTPQEMKAVLADTKNVQLMGKLSEAFNPRSGVYQGAPFTKTLRALGLSKSPKLSGTSTKELSESMDKSIKAVDENGKPLSTVDKDGRIVADEKATSDQRLKPVSQEVKAKSGVLGAAGSVALDAACSGVNTANKIRVGIKLARIAATAAFALTIYNTVDKMIAQDASEAEMTFIGNQLTSIDTRAKVADPSKDNEMVDNPNLGKSPTDAIGYKAAAYNDIAKPDVSLAQYIITAGAIAAPLSSIFTAVDSIPGGMRTVKIACGLLSNKAVGVFGSFQCAAAIASVIIPGVNAATGTDAAFCAGMMVAGAAMQVAFSMLASHFIDKYGFIKLSAATIGPDALNAIFVGTGAILGFAAADNGFAPASNSEFKTYLANTNAGHEAEIAALKYRASKTPFDVTNPYTPVGAITAQVPIFTVNTSSLFTSLTSGLKAFGTVVSNPLSPQAYAAYSMSDKAYNGQRLTQLPVQELTDIGVDADMSGNPRFVMSGSVLDSEIEPNIEYMISNGYVDDNSATVKPAATDNGKIYQKYLDFCTSKRISGSNPAPWGEDVRSFEEVGIVQSQEEDDWNTGKKCREDSEMIQNFQAFQSVSSLDSSLNQDVDVIEAGAGAAGAGSSATAATPEICKTLTPTDPGQIACHAYQFSNTMYKWGGGHSGTAAQFMADFKAGKYPPGSATVDCSGLVRMTIFETYGVDIGGAGSDSFFSTGHFDKVPPEQAKPGDLIIILGSHVEIVVNNKVDQRSFDTIGAHSVHLPLGQSIGPVSDWYNYSKASYILRWKG